MDIGLLLLRLTVGLTIGAHGAQILFGRFGGPGLDGTGQFFEMLGFRPGRRHALMAGLAETGGGLFLALGLLTPVCALMLAVDMLVAIMTNRIQSIQAKSVVAWLADFLYLPELLYVMLLVWLIFSGPGRYSIDGLIARRAGVAGVEREPRAAA